MEGLCGAGGGAEVGGQGQFGVGELGLGARNRGACGEGAMEVYEVQSTLCIGEVRKEAVGLLPPKSS